MSTKKRSNLSRREFVKSASAAAVAAIAAPTIIPSSALGNADQAPPSERLGIGFIGMGKQCGGHVGRMFSERNVQILAVCDVDTTRREFFRNHIDEKYAELEQKDYKGCKSYVDYRELLAQPGIDAVFIVVPDHWHTTMSIEAAKAKKDIYCEKPLTLTIGEAKTIIDAVRKYERVFQTGSQQRSEPEYFRQACEYVRNGRLGNLKEIHVGIGTTSKPCDLPAQDPDPGLNWDMWLGQAPKRPYNEILCRKGLPDTYPFNPGWRDYREYSGGHITDWGAHHFDIVQWALDKDNSGPVEIRPPEKEGELYGASFIYRDTPAGAEVPVIHKSTVYEYDGKDGQGKQQHFVENNGILFIGEKGKLFVNRGKIVTDPESILATPIGDNDKKLYKSPGHHADWLKCIQTRERPVADVEVGARSVTACHLMNLAYWNHKRLQWDPQKWEFTGNNAAEANKWIHREQRDPYKLPTI